MAACWIHSSLFWFILTCHLPSTNTKICKGIQRLVDNPSLSNEYNKGTGWYGKGETGKGQFVASPEAFVRSNYDVRGGACIPNEKYIECHQSKGKANCNEAQTCTKLLDIKKKLLSGGYNCFGRHERTYWHQWYGEAGCLDAGNCFGKKLSPGTGQPSGSYLTPTRYLSSWGYKASKVAADAFHSLGLSNNSDIFSSSPFPRCVDGLQLFAKKSGRSVAIEERLMYFGAILENVKRKGKCKKGSDVSYLYRRQAEMSVFDGMRKMAGTPPKKGHNNWYMTHGTNMKGAFGEQISEGYWMCIKPDINKKFPLVNKSHVVVHEVCPNETIKVDFSNVFQFETDFLLSSESFHLMNSCSKMATLNNDIFARDTLAPKLALTLDEVGSVIAFKKLLEIQDHALDMVPNTPGFVQRSVYHLGLFVHNNGGYRFPDTVSVPLRRIIEDTITSHGKTRFAIAQAIIDAGDKANYSNCNLATNSTAKVAIATCYNKKFNNGGKKWYWGGKDKAQVNIDHDFVESSVYGSLKWQGSPKWYANEYVSGYIDAGACLVTQGRVTLWKLLHDMGCQQAADVEKTKSSSSVANVVRLDMLFVVVFVVAYLIMI